MGSLKESMMTDGEIHDISFGAGNRPPELEADTPEITKKGIIERLFPVNLKVRFLFRGFSRQSNSQEKQRPKT